MKRIFLIVALLLISACSGKPHVVEAPTDSRINASSQTHIFVVNHGWHTGIVIPTESIRQSLPTLYQRFDSSHYIEIGWGDKAFYQAPEIMYSLAIPALLWPTDSVIHAVGLMREPAKAFSNSHTERICINQNGMTRLIEFINHSFARNHNREIIELPKGLYGDSQFYQGVGDFHMMNTCNKWTAKGLKSAGLDISPYFKLTASSVMKFINENSTSASSPCPH